MIVRRKWMRILALFFAADPAGQHARRDGHRHEREQGKDAERPDHADTRLTVSVANVPMRDAVS